MRLECEFVVNCDTKEGAFFDLADVCVVDVKWAHLRLIQECSQNQSEASSKPVAIKVEKPVATRVQGNNNGCTLNQRGKLSPIPKSKMASTPKSTEEKHRKVKEEPKGHYVEDTQDLAPKEKRRDSKCDVVHETQRTTPVKREEFGFDDIPSTSQRKRQRSSNDLFGFNALSSKKKAKQVAVTDGFGFDDIPSSRRGTQAKLRDEEEADERKKAETAKKRDETKEEKTEENLAEEEEPIMNRIKEKDVPESFDPNLPVNLVQIAFSESLIDNHRNKQPCGPLPGAVGDYVEWKGQRVRNFKRFKKVVHKSFRYVHLEFIKTFIQ
ncbi:hypothetical protein CAPTEDRAFT_193263 [Capitella teleta]|uniref:Uncharacterized protein n=1 Tax=Capitella teleta TaxID=283909 RepID=R7V8M6_CAPTE|nr:hypothetical protein CAPTEDRAFT_193263 [Capitella teleta]|eukprot:ELU15173.1 hypothetical protein CAPTEDRAFT_193263 [Capitella teleta]